MKAITVNDQREFWTIFNEELLKRFQSVTKRGSYDRTKIKNEFKKVLTIKEKQNDSKN